MRWIILVPFCSVIDDFSNAIAQLAIPITLAGSMGCTEEHVDPVPVGTLAYILPSGA